MRDKSVKDRHTKHRHPKDEPQKRKLKNDKPVILVVGLTPCMARTMMFERFILGGVNRSESQAEYASGKGVNAVRAICTTNLAASFYLGLTGGDRTYAFLEALKNLGSAYESIDTYPNEIRLCTTIIDQMTGVVTELVEEPPAVAKSVAQSLLDSFDRIIDDVDAVLVIGSVPKGLGNRTYKLMIDMAKEAGKLAVVDAAGAALTNALTAKPHVVRINENELLGMVGATAKPSDEAVINAMRAVANQTGGAVVVSRAERSTLVLEFGRVTEITPPEVDVVSGIGGGDVMSGVITAMLACGKPLVEAVVFAQACAADSATTTRSAHFSLNRAKRMVGKIVKRDVGQG